MNHSNTPRSKVVDGFLDITHKFGNRKARGDVVADSKECFLVHLTGIGMIPPQHGDFFFHFIKKRSIYDASMAIILNHKEGPVRADGIEFLAIKKAPFAYRIGRGTKSNHGFHFATRQKVGNQLFNFLIRARVHHIQTGIKGGKTCQMLMSVDKGRA